MKKPSRLESISQITFYGDSIFDNRPYVYSDDETVAGWAERVIECPTRMEAIDGHVTHQLLAILSELPEQVDPAAGAVISIGGNDALQAQWILNMPAKTVGLAFQEMQPVLDTFRRNYIKVLEAALKRFEVGNLRVCTVYNGIPDLPTMARTALGLFNDIISEEAGLRGIGVIDLRVVCADPECYSDISSIEPSNHGAEQIAHAVKQAFS